MTMRSRTKTKVPDLLPAWLDHLYSTLGTPVVRPDPWDTGVRFLNDDGWVDRRHWVWTVNQRNYKFRIDRYRDFFRTVAGIGPIEGFLIPDQTHVELTTPEPATGAQIMKLLDLAGFPV